MHKWLIDDSKFSVLKKTITKIINCAQNVQTNLVDQIDVSEAVVQKALSIEFTKNVIIHAVEETMPIKYKCMHVGYVRADFIVYSTNQQYILEIKRDRIITNEAKNQLFKYLYCDKFDKGILITFLIQSSDILYYVSEYFKKCQLELKISDSMSIAGYDSNVIVGPQDIIIYKVVS